MSTPKVDSATVLRGSVDVDILDLETGERIRVTVRAIRIREIQDYLVAQSDEVTHAAFVTGVPEAEVEGWHIDSIRAVCVAAEEINDPFVSAWLDRAERRAANLAQVASSAPHLFRSASGSQTSPSGLAEPSTRSAP